MVKVQVRFVGNRRSKPHQAARLSGAEKSDRKAGLKMVFWSNLLLCVPRSDINTIYFHPSTNYPGHVW